MQITRPQAAEAPKMSNFRHFRSDWQITPGQRPGLFDRLQEPPGTGGSLFTWYAVKEDDHETG